MVYLSLFLSTDILGQTNLLTEDFSGFKTGTHSSPSTFDVSALLDQKLQTTGWTGYRIYEAGGEAKLGIASSPGWIESTLLTIASGSQLTLSFDLASWPGDNATVQIYLNGVSYGNVISPPETNRKEVIQLQGIEGDLKIKIAGVSKRFFLDNISLSSDIVNKITESTEAERYRIFPVPVADIINIEHLTGGEDILIMSLSGQILFSERNYSVGRFTIGAGFLDPGTYLVKIISPEVGVSIRALIKM
jgi:hypothetical protein